MSWTMLEATRAGHEELERLERLIVNEIRNGSNNYIVRHLIDGITAASLNLVDIYDDKYNQRNDEIADLGSPNSFYNQVPNYYHNHQTNAQVSVFNNELPLEPPRIKFTGEESFGRYLDLHELYNYYINSKFGEPMEYYAYLNVFSQPSKYIPRKYKNKAPGPYRYYLDKLVEYLVSFLDRTEPLLDLDRMFAKVASEFEEQWANGKVDAIEKKGVIDLDCYDTVEKLMEVEAERLKEGLAAVGLKIGGTVKQRAERLFHTKHTPIEKLDNKYLAKGWKEIALMETKIEKLCELLDETIVRTIQNVEKKQALTYEEMQAEREDAQIDDDDGDVDVDEKQIYNPLKLPMGWDGKPIPYWLYKLHGLSQEFKCEICGNRSYWGRRDYERHFKESLHQHGMRCLGIPNTKSFNEITCIEEAKQLWGRMQERKGVKRWRPDLKEEFEDGEGNIYNKKTFTDLLRQGLI